MGIRVDYQKLAAFRNNPISPEQLAEAELFLREAMANHPKLFEADLAEIIKASIPAGEAFKAKLAGQPGSVVAASARIAKFLAIGDIKEAATLFAEAVKQAAQETTQPYILRDAEIGQRYSEQQRKGGKRKSDKYETARQMCREIASDRWEKEHEQGKPISQKTPVAKEISRALAIDLPKAGLRKLPHIDTIKEWITPIAPPEASRPGRK